MSLHLLDLLCSVSSLKIFDSTSARLILRLEKAPTLINLQDLLPFDMCQKNWRINGIVHLSGLWEEPRFTPWALIVDHAKMISIIFLSLTSLNYVYRVFPARIRLDKTLVKSLKLYRWVIGQNFLTRICNPTSTLCSGINLASAHYIRTILIPQQWFLLILYDCFFNIIKLNFDRIQRRFSIDKGRCINGHIQIVTPVMTLHSRVAVGVVGVGVGAWVKCAVYKVGLSWLLVFLSLLKVLHLIIELLRYHLLLFVFFDQFFDVLEGPVFLRVRPQVHEVDEKSELLLKAEHLVLACHAHVKLLLLGYCIHHLLDQLSIIVCSLFLFDYFFPSLLFLFSLVIGLVLLILLLFL